MRTTAVMLTGTRNECGQCVGGRAFHPKFDGIGPPSQQLFESHVGIRHEEKVVGGCCAGRQIVFPKVRLETFDVHSRHILGMGSYVVQKAAARALVAIKVDPDVEERST